MATGAQLDPAVALFHSLSDGTRLAGWWLDQPASERVAVVRLGGDLAEGLLGHARIVFQRHRRDVATADKAGEGDDGADVVAAGQ